MANMNVKTGDNVLVLTGKDAGKQGRVLACYPKKNRVVVEGVNIISRHTKPRNAKESGGIVKKEGTIDVSNVMVVCATCGKPTRVKHNIVDGKNVRVCHRCGATLDKKFEKVAKAKTVKAKKTAEATTEDKQVKKTKVEKTEKKTRVSSAKNKAETANIKRKQDM